MAVRLACEEADAGEEIPRKLAFVAGCDPLDERVDKPAVDLEERAVVHAKVEAGGAIGEGIDTPLGDGAVLLGRDSFTETSLVHKLRAL